MINNWNKQKPEIGSESYCDNYKLISISNSERCNTPPLDDVFFLYLKEFSEKIGVPVTEILQTRH